VIDILEHINAIHRHVSRTGEDVSVVLKRSYGAPVEDVWDALTDPERMRRWFMPITGELKIGGSFQLEGNAGGEILECEPPSRFKVTFGGPTSLLGLALYLAGETIEDPVAATNSPEALRFSERSVRRWIAVVRESGTATADELSAATEVSLAQFAPGVPSSED
jgi:uncharacterized protein YndB with AHSA1/START domain